LTYSQLLRMVNISSRTPSMPACGWELSLNFLETYRSLKILLGELSFWAKSVSTLKALWHFYDTKSMMIETFLIISCITLHSRSHSIQLLNMTSDTCKGDKRFPTHCKRPAGHDPCLGFVYTSVQRVMSY
jgi:hypothetical protein